VTTVLPAAALDPDLPQLAAGTDPEHVRRLFAARLPADGPPGASVLDSERMHTDYRPGTRCRISYRLRLAAPGVEPWCSFGQVLVHRTGLDLCWYDADPDLPAAPTAASPTRMHERLDRWTGVAAPAWQIRPVRYRAGARCVLCYRPADGAPVLFGKLYRRDAEQHARAQAGLRDTLDAERSPGIPRPVVPAVVGYDQQLGLVMHASVAGRTLGALAFAPAADKPTRLRALHAAGGQLAGLHVSAGTAGPVRSFATDLAELRGYLAVVRQADRVLAQRYARLTELAYALLDGSVDLAPAHGALRTDQVLVGPDGIVLLDLDSLGWAEPARDVGNLLGYLSWRAVRRPAERAFLAAAHRAFLDGYREHSRGLDEGRLRGYQAATLLKIAGRRFRSLQYDEWPLVPELVERAAALLPVRRRPSTRPGPARPAAVLAEVTEPARMTAELAVLLGNGADPVPVRAADLLAHRAGRTAVVRYRLDAALGRDQVLLGKLYPDRGVALRAHDIHVRLHAALPGGDGPVLPEPIGVLPARAMLLLRPVDGRQADRIRADADAAPAAIRGAARWLARLHGSAAVLGRRLDLLVEQENVAAWARMVHAGLPAVAIPARELAAGLSAALGRLRIRHDVPIHKDFHYQHVLVGARTAVIDLDEARMGDPALDVAHFACYLDLLAARRTATGGLRAAFLHGYAEQCGWELDPAYRVFSAWTCLKIAKQLSTGRGPHPRPTGGEALNQARHVLARGLAWLG